MNKLLILSVVCALGTVGVAAAQQRGATPANTDGATAGQCEHHGKRGHGRMHGKFFERMDANQDGRITRDEMRAHLEDKFNTMDLNGDGAVTREEAREAFQQLRQREGHGNHERGNRGNRGEGQSNRQGAKSAPRATR